MIGANIVPALLSLTTAFVQPASDSASPVDVLVLRENGVGSAATAQSYIDRVMEAVATVNGWPAAKGAYHTRRSKAESYIAASKPDFGIINLSAFLALRSEHDLDVVGTADVQGGGGQYFIVSKAGKNLGACKGKTLATNHAQDPRFLEHVVAKRAWKLGDFQLDETRRPLQTLKKVIRDEAACALIDDAQLADLGNIDGGDDLAPVWKSNKLVPMIVVAFPHAPEPRVKRFRGNLGKVCTGVGKEACEEAGLAKLSPASDKAVQGLISAYQQ